MSYFILPIIGYNNHILNIIKHNGIPFTFHRKTSLHSMSIYTLALIELMMVM